MCVIDKGCDPVGKGESLKPSRNLGHVLQTILYDFGGQAHCKGDRRRSESVPGVESAGKRKDQLNGSFSLTWNYLQLDPGNRQRGYLTQKIGIELLFEGKRNHCPGELFFYRSSVRILNI